MNKEIQLPESGNDNGEDRERVSGVKAVRKIIKGLVWKFVDKGFRVHINEDGGIEVSGKDGTPLE